MLLLVSGINLVTVIEFSDTLFQLVVSKWRNRKWLRGSPTSPDSNHWANRIPNKLDVKRQM